MEIGLIITGVIILACVIYCLWYYDTYKRWKQFMVSYYWNDGKNDGWGDYTVSITGKITSKCMDALNEYLSKDIFPNKKTTIIIINLIKLKS